MTAQPIVLAWSGGKDSALAFHALRQSDSYRIVALLSNFTDDDRLIMHRVPRALVEQQVQAMGIPLHPVILPSIPSNSEYEARTGAALAHFREQGVSTIAHGDLFLEDIRQYRDGNLARVGMTGLYPLWGLNTRDLAHQFISDGFRAVIVCVDTQQLDESFVGRTFDESFLSDLPPNVDPCGENGEFHTFVYDAPFFSTPVACSLGESYMTHDRFIYRDLR